MHFLFAIRFITLLSWLENRTSLVLIRVVIAHLNVSTTELNIIMLSIVLFLLTLSLTLRTNFKPSIIRNLTVCARFTLLEDDVHTSV